MADLQTSHVKLEENINVRVAKMDSKFRPVDKQLKNLDSERYRLDNLVKTLTG